MPPQDRGLVLTFTHARRPIAPPSTLDLKLATLPAPDQWGVWVRRTSVVLSACPMAGRMFSSTAPLYEPVASDFHEFSPSFVSEYVDNFKRGGVLFYEGADPIYFSTDDQRFGTPVVSELYVHSKAVPCDVRSLYARYQAIAAGVHADASSASTVEAPRVSTPPTLPLSPSSTAAAATGAATSTAAALFGAPFSPMAARSGTPTVSFGSGAGTGPPGVWSTAAGRGAARRMFATLPPAPSRSQAEEDFYRFVDSHIRSLLNRVCASMVNARQVEWRLANRALLVALVNAVPNGELDKLRLDGRDGAATAQSVMRDLRSHFVGDDRSFNCIVRAVVGWVGVTMQPTDDFASLANKLGVARSLLIQSDRVAAMTGIEVIDMMDIALMLYRIGQDKRYSQIIQFLRMETDITRARIREVIVNAERGMTGNWVHVPQQQRQLTATGLAAVDVTDALRLGFDQRWCAAFIDGKCSGDTCPNGRPTPFVHPKTITAAMKAFASAYAEYKARRGGRRSSNDGRRSSDRRGRGNDRQGGAADAAVKKQAMMANAKGLLGKMDAAQKQALLAACKEAARADGNDDGDMTDVAFTTVIKGTANAIKGYAYDSGATCHVTPSPIPGSVGGVGIEVTTADGSTQRGDRVGAIGTISDIHIVPEFERDLLSAGKMIDATAGGAHVITSGGVYVITPEEMDQISVVLARDPIATRSNDTGGLYICNKKAFGMSAITPENPATVFHEAAGHMSKEYMLWLLKNPSQVHGTLPYTQKDVMTMLPCFGCSAGMYKRGSFTGSWDNIHSSSDAICFTDTFGPTKTAAIGGYHYAQLFVTRRSRTSGVVLMKRAADAPSAVAKFFETSGMKYRMIPTAMYMDNAPENIGPDMRAVLSDAGCRAEYCAPHGGDNNIAEVYIGIVTRGARALLAHAGLDTKFWGLAWLHFNHLRNMLPCKYNHKRMSSFQIELGRPPDVTMLVPFGAIGLVQLPHDSRQRAREEKMASAVRKCIFVGYSDQHHGAFKCYFPDNGRVLIRRDVRWQSKARPMRGPGDAAFRDFRKHVELAVDSGELPSSEFAGDVFDKIKWDDAATAAVKRAAVIEAFDRADAVRLAAAAGEMTPATWGDIEDGRALQRLPAVTVHMQGRVAHLRALNSAPGTVALDAAKAMPGFQRDGYAVIMDEDPPHVMPGINSFILLFAPDTVTWDELAGADLQGMAAAAGFSDDYELLARIDSPACRVMDTGEPKVSLPYVRIYARIIDPTARVAAQPARISTSETDRDDMARAVGAVGPYVDDPHIMPGDDAADDMVERAGLGVFPRDQQLGSKLPMDAEVVIMQQNPKKVGSKSRVRYNRYKNATTLGGMKDLGASSGDIRHDHAHGFIQIYAHKNADGVLVRNEPLTVNAAIASSAGARQQERRRADVARELREVGAVIPDSVRHGGVLDAYKATDFETPKNTNAAKQHVLWPMFKAAIVIEMQQMHDKGVMIEVNKQDIPRHLRHALIRTKMVLALKSGPDGEVTKAKARLVACGYSQVEGRDYDQTYAPTGAKMSMRFLIAMAIRWRMYLFEFDVEGAFLLPELDRELYGTVDGRVYRFLRPIYGLKQSAYIWNAAFDKEMNRLKLKASIVDPCFYFGYSRKGRVMLCGHVDDCMGAAKDEACYKHFVACFMYPLSTSGPLTFVLKIKVRYGDDGCVYLSQRAYIEGLAVKFGVADANPKHTPMETGAVLSKLQQPAPGSGEQAAMASVPFREAYGAMLYVSEVRPDIKGALTILGRYIHNPGQAHWKALKRVLVYLNTTKDRELCIGRGINDNSQEVVTIWVDADHGRCPDSRRSTSGVVITIRGSTIDCISKRQGSVSNSTAASELKAMLVAVHKTTIVRTLFAEIGVTLDPVRVLTDSQVALDMLKRGHPSTATKHLAQVYYEVKEAETNGMCVFIHTPGVDNVSDIATKPLTRVPFTKHRDNMLNDLGPKPTYAEKLTGVRAGE